MTGNSVFIDNSTGVRFRCVTHRCRLRSRAIGRFVGLVILPIAVHLSGSCLRAQEIAPDAIAILAAVEAATISAIESAEHSVVAISRVRRDRAPAAQLAPLRLGNPFPFQETPDNPDFVPTFFGSGVVISEDGFIATCAHVLDDPRKNDYYVWLDKQSYAARVIGMPAKVMAADPFSDLAVLKIEADNLRPALFSKAKIRKGQFVIALGNPYAIARDGRASASWGIISNLNRVAPSENGRTDANKETLHQFGTLIQTDAKLNFGTSGGALVNLQGEMIGLTTSLAATSGFEQSAGYAIAVDAMFERVLESLKLGQLPEYGFLGIQPEDLRSVDKARGLTGARVSVVIPGLPGEAAGLRSDDVIFQVDETLIEDRNDLFRELSRSAAGDTVQLLVQRPRAGRKTPDILQLSALLSKKYVATSRPAYALHSQSAWRGMLVEYATAMPSELARGGFLSGRSGAPKVAILSVDPDTAAWKAGLRPGYGIVSVEDTPIESPEDFYRSVERYADSVSVAVIRDAQRIETISVGP